MNQPDGGGSTRLLYEPLMRSHALELCGALTDPRVYEYIPGPNPSTLDELYADFGDRVAGPPPEWQEEKWWNYAVRERGSGRAVGRLEAMIIEGRAEVSYLFGPAHWGRGYASEGLTWLHERLRQDGSALAFWAAVTPGNDRSVRVLQRLRYDELVGGWPALASYDPGDRVFRRNADAEPIEDRRSTCGPT